MRNKSIGLLRKQASQTKTKGEKIRFKIDKIGFRRFFVIIGFLIGIFITTWFFGKYGFIFSILIMLALLLGTNLIKILLGIEDNGVKGNEN